MASLYIAFYKEGIANTLQLNMANLMKNISSNAQIQTTSDF